MIYKTLTELEKEEMLIQTLKSQEMDLYIHSLNKERFEDMIPTLPIGDPFRQKLESEVVVIDSRLVEVNTILTSLEKQIPVDTNIATVLARIKAKEDAAKR